MTEHQIAETLFPLCSDFTRKDWLMLALLALDQSAEGRQDLSILLAMEAIERELED